MSEFTVPWEILQEWVREAGHKALAHSRGVRATLKADGTPVTQVDKAIESYLVERISEHWPDHAILGEEAGAHRRDSPYLWVIDPLDGTRAYAGGLPVWGISVGLLEEGEPKAGVFYLPAIDAMYWADAEGAFRNGEPVQPLPFAGPDDPLAYLLVPSNAHLIYEITFPRIRSLGSTAAHLLYVACSTAVGAVTRRAYLWDVAGVLPLLQHCGIKLAYLSGAPFSLRALLDNPRLSEPLIAARTEYLEVVRDAIRRKAAF